MKPFAVITLAILSILAPTWAKLAEIAPTPKLSDYAEAGGRQETSDKVQNPVPGQCPKIGKPLSEVSITVGEKNGFFYTVDGFTYSPEKISVSGLYFNDEYAHRGYVNLFLGVESGISYFDVRPKGGDTLISVDNFNYQRFYFEVHAPYPVTIRNLYIRQFNATAILVDGPSRSAPYFKHAN